MTGSNGERQLQLQSGTQNRAQGFYDNQMLQKLNPAMVDFIAKQQMVFISTADARGNCDTSFRGGDAGFVKVLDENTVAYPEYRGNGVYASLGNILDNPHIGLLFIDFFEHCIGLHVNGTATIEQGVDGVSDSRSERWVCITVEEAYIHCSKHIPLLNRLDKDIHWGTDDVQLKGGDYFRAKVSKSFEMS